MLSCKVSSDSLCIECVQYFKGDSSTMPLAIPVFLGDTLKMKRFLTSSRNSLRRIRYTNGSMIPIDQLIIEQTSVAVGCVIRAFGAIYFCNISKYCKSFSIV